MAIPARQFPVEQPPAHIAQNHGWPRFPFPAALGAIALAGIASWFSFLETTKHHPLLKLGGAMFIAASGMAIVVAARHLGGHPDLGATAVAGGRWAAGTRGALQVVLAPVVASLSMSAALIHFAVIQEHWREYFLYGAFFVLAGLFQIVWMFLVVTRPSAFLYAVGLVGNLGIAAAWVVTRTVGVLVGPAAKETEMVGFGDALSTVFEVLIVVGCAVLLRQSWARIPLDGARAEVVVDVSLVAITTITILGLFSAVGGPPFVSHVG